MDKIQKKKDIALVISVLAYIMIIVLLYFVFILAGIDSLKALVESIVISTTIITMVILYLFGKIWKQESSIKKK